MPLFIPQIDSAQLLSNQLVPRYFITPEPSDTPLGKTYLGTPYYDQLTFFAPQTNTFFAGGIVGGVIQTPSNLTNLVMHTVLISVHMTKIIQKTQVTGKNGTVKEYISDGDYSIRISGQIVGRYGNQYPKTEVAKLINYCTIADAIKVQSGFLDMFKINSMVIDDYDIAEAMGSRNSVPFEIYASSDAPIEFQLQ